MRVYKESTGPYWIAEIRTTPMPAELTQCIAKWCYNTYGPGLGDYRVAEPKDSPFVHRWVNDIKWGEVRFSNEADLNWFVLRWSDD